MSGRGPLDTAVLPAGVRSRFLDDVNGLRVHVLEAGNPKNPACYCCTASRSSPTPGAT
jgi:hypothetical protein